MPAKPDDKSMIIREIAASVRMHEEVEKPYAQQLVDDLENGQMSDEFTIKVADMLGVDNDHLGLLHAFLDHIDDRLAGRDRN